jgi:hypothetical protein
LSAQAAERGYTGSETFDHRRSFDHWRRLDPVGTVSGSLVTVDPVGRTMDRLDHWRRLMSVVTLDKADLFVCVPGHLDKVGSMAAPVVKPVRYPASVQRPYPG